MGGGGGSTYTTLGQKGPEFSALKIQTSVRGMVIPVVFGTNRISGNLIWYGDFKQSGVTGTLTWYDYGKGGGGHTYTMSWEHHYYTVAFALALCEGPVSISKMWLDKTKYETIPEDLLFFSGATIQPKWGYMETYHPDQSLNYPGIAYLAAPNFVLIDTDRLPNFNVEIIGFHASPTDANPALIISTIANDFRIGLAANIPVFSKDYEDWCIASGLLLSPAYAEQSFASDVIKTILDHTFSVAIWSDGRQLKLVPLADVSVSGGGRTFVPDTDPKYDLSDEDFFVEEEEEPILISRKSPAECYNIIRIECANRDADYNVESIEVMDQASIDIYFQRPADSIKAWDICDPAIARKLAQLKLQYGLYVRNEYRFKLTWRHCLLEPMDVVTLTDEKLGMDHYTVRIKEIEEDSNYILSVVAEDFAAGIGQAETYSNQGNLSVPVDRNADPGNVNEPIIFLAPDDLWESATKPEIWIIASGAGEYWGGYDLHFSHDNTTYKYAGTILGKPKQGLLSAVLPVGSDPDTANTLSVDLSMSDGGLISGIQVDADNLVTMCVILNGELEIISYQTATLTDLNKYDLTYIRRGQKGTVISAHGAGSGFARLDEKVFKIKFDSIWLANNVYFKFASFNIWFANKQNLADVTAYMVTKRNSMVDTGIGTDVVSVTP